MPSARESSLARKGKSPAVKGKWPAVRWKFAWRQKGKFADAKGKVTCGEGKVCWRRRESDLLSGESLPRGKGENSLMRKGKSPSVKGKSADAEVIRLPGGKSDQSACGRDDHFCFAKSEYIFYKVNQLLLLEIIQDK